jgi:hypothetical protein
MSSGSADYTQGVMDRETEIVELINLRKIALWAIDDGSYARTARVLEAVIRDIQDSSVRKEHHGEASSK